MEINLRKQYGKQKLNKDIVKPDPMEQFDIWFQEALKADINEPYTMCLSTVHKNGRPSSRIVLLRDYHNGGMVFYTNYQSSKSADLAQTPYAALNFYWAELERQVRVEGRVVKTEGAVSDKYFDSRPLGSRISAVASPQSKIIQNRDELLKKVEEIAGSIEGETVKRPEYWGGYLVVPYMVEFWQGRENRLHDRIRYQMEGEGWKVDRLAP